MSKENGGFVDDNKMLKFNILIPSGARGKDPEVIEISKKNIT